MKYSKASVIEKGLEAARKNDRALAVKTLMHTNIEERCGKGSYVAVAAAIVNDCKWNKKTVINGLDSAGIEEDFDTIERKLVDEGILLFTRQISFNPDFIFIYMQVHDQLLDDAPAKMLPLENVDPWIAGRISDYKIPLVSNTPKKVSYAVSEEVLDAVNRLQSVRFVVSLVLVQVLENMKETVRAKAVKRKRLVSQLDQQLLVLSEQIKMLKELAESKREISLAVTMDKRGRCYYRGGLLTPQGHDFQKAAFQFAEPKKLGKHGKRALAIHYANVAGQDKLSQDERVRWTETIGTDRAREIGVDLKFPKWASDPYQTVVAAHEWYKLMEHEAKGKKASKFKSSLVVHQDGSCNGYQHGAALLRHRPTAEATNCTASDASDTPRDVYLDANKILHSILLKHEDERLAEIIERLGRSCTKKPVMVTGYGAGAKTAFDNLIDDMSIIDKGIMLKHENYVNAALQEALHTVGGALIDFTNSMKGAVKQKMEQEIGPLYWDTKDGFRVFQATRAKPGQGEYLGAASYVYRIDEINANRQESSVAANFVHSQDATHMRECVREADFEIVNVHDSYGCHAGNYFKLSKIIREKFVELHEYDQLASFNKCNDLNVEVEQGDYDLKEVKKSTYFFS